MEGKDKLGVLRKCMESLPHDQMLALRLRDVMGYEMEEIAKILDTSEGNVRTLLSRARKKMKEKLTRHGKDI
jgi:RNA polymerase sigma-70 factor (ECF subfamily)